MEDFLRGAFLGAAVGDALGGPVENMSSAEIKEKYGTIREMAGGGWLDLDPGEWTDDTSMTLDVARGILANPAYPVEEIGHNFLRWYRSGPKDIGRTTAESIKNYLKAGNWKEASQMTARTLNKMDSNGGLMRTLPVTFGYWNDMQKIAKWSAEICMMTHYSYEGATCCIFYNILVRLSAGGGSRRQMVSRALDLTDSFCREMKITPSRFFWHMIKHIQKDAPRVIPRGNALDTLAASVQAFLLTGSFEEALVDVVNRGEDADTAGCITGGLAGAYYGSGGIPGRWLDSLKKRHEIDAVINEFISYWKQKGMDG
ncbi:MAG: ADP-ribosylglycohydrolase family protein [Peptococcaceae bacterium]|nr:ADP-ribosylglycohydrolase family protein [Peptococcaceae bacterium]